MPTYGRRRSRSCGARAPSCGTTTGKRVPRLPLRPRRDVARPRPPRGGRGHRRAGPHARSTSRTCSAPSVGPDGGAARSTGCSAAAARCSSPTRGAEANECAIKLARKCGGRGRHVVVSAYGSFHGRTLATLHATGQPAKHEAFQPLPEGFRHVAWDDLDDLERADRPRRSPPCCSSRCRARAASTRPRRVLRRACARLCDERGRAVHRRRGADRPRPHRRVVRLPALRRRARRRHHGQGARQRHADRRLLGPRRGGRGLRARRPRHDLRRPAARRRRGPRPCCAVMERDDVPAPGRQGRAPASPTALGRPARRHRGAGPRPAAGRRARRRHRRQGRAAGRCLDAGLVVNAVTPTALRFAPPLLVTDDEIDEAARPILGRAASTAGAVMP